MSDRIEYVDIQFEPIEQPNGSDTSTAQDALLLYAPQTGSFALAITSESRGQDRPIALGRRVLEFPTLDSFVSALAERNCRLTFDSTDDAYTWDTKLRTRIGNHEVVGLTNPKDPDDKRLFLLSPDRQHYLQLQAPFVHPGYRLTWGPQQADSPDFLTDNPRIRDTAHILQSVTYGNYGDPRALDISRAGLIGWLSNQPPNWSATAASVTDYVLGVDDTGTGITTHINNKDLAQLHQEQFGKQRTLMRRAMEL